MRVDESMPAARRKAQGAYYTADWLCDVVVAQTFAADLWRDWHRAQAESAAAMRLHADRVAALRVCDPACGDGAMLRAAARAIQTLWLAMQRDIPLPPHDARRGMRGLDVDRDAVAACQAHGIPATHGDALATDWPACDFIVGNPPFLGGSKLRTVLGDAAAARVRALSPHINQYADLAVHWWDRAARLCRDGQIDTFGFVMPTGYTAIFAQRSIAHYFTGPAALGVKWAAKGIVWPSHGADVRVCITVCGRGIKEGRLVAAD